MKSRREFLKASASLAAAGMLVNFPLMSFAKSKWPDAGLQLYTIGGKLDENLDTTLETVAKIGYKNIESAFSRKGGFYGLKPKEFAEKIKNLGMRWQSHHAIGAPFRPRPNADGTTPNIPPVKNLQDNHQEIIDDVAEAGLPYLVCPGTPIGTMDEIKKSMDVLVKTGEACKKAGIIFAFHNHTKEFETIEGTTPMEMFLTQISEDILKIELDLGWATKAGADPVAMFERNPGRFPLWHVKDLDKDQKPTEIGAGSVDFKRIFGASKKAGLKYYFVEQDQAPSPLDNIQNSYNGLKKILS